VRLRALVRGGAESVLARLPRRTQPGDRLILAYHNVVPAGSPPVGDRSLHLPLDRFEAQLRLMRDEAEVVPLLELLATDAPGERRIAITFDDAYASALRLGVGACVAAGAPCTVFVAPGLLGTVPVWDRRAAAERWSDADREAFLWRDRGTDVAAGVGGRSESAPTATGDPCRIATTDELLACAARPGVTLGNHTMHHPNLGALADDEVRAELAAAHAWLEAHAAGRLVPVLAYPYGLAPRQPEVALDATPVRFGALVTGGWWARDAVPRPYAVPRWNVPAGLSDLGFEVRLRGRMQSHVVA
jgi:peptidoglycan/xylan/chitin deacetylase (PgdA/CDA1 family)